LGIAGRDAGDTRQLRQLEAFATTVSVWSTWSVILLFFVDIRSGALATRANFCLGVMPLKVMSWPFVAFYIQSQRVADSCASAFDANRD